MYTRWTNTDISKYTRGVTVRQIYDSYDVYFIVIYETIRLIFPSCILEKLYPSVLIARSMTDCKPSQSILFLVQAL